MGLGGFRAYGVRVKGFRGSGFGVQCSVVWGFGFRRLGLKGLGFSGLGFRVLRFRVQGLGFRLQG